MLLSFFMWWIVLTCLPSMDFEHNNRMNLRCWVRVWIGHNWLINFLNTLTNLLVPSNSRNSLSHLATISLSFSLYRSAYELCVTSQAVDLPGRKRDATYCHRSSAASDADTKATHVIVHMQRRIRLEALYGLCLSESQLVRIVTCLPLAQSFGILSHIQSALV